MVLKAKKDKINAARRRWRARLIAKGSCTRCVKEKAAPHRQCCMQCLIQQRKYIKKHNTGLKKKILAHYGSACACCGEAEPAFLSLDHINNDGYKEKSSSCHFYRKTIKAGFPTTLQIFCHNCNHGKYINGGSCPHDKDTRSNS